MTNPTPQGSRTGETAPAASEDGPTADAEPTRLAKAAKVFGLTKDLVTPTNVAVGALVLILAGVGLTGGWGAVAAEADAEADTVPTKAAGEVFTAKPFQLAITKARAFDELPGVLPKSKGARYLVVAADVTDTDARYVEDDAGITRHLIDDDAVSIDAKGLVDQLGKPLTEGKAPRPTVLRVNDTQRQAAFQPGVLTPVIVVFEQASSEPVPTELTVTVNSFTWRKSTLDNHYFWADPKPAAKVTLPVVAK